ncbi:gastrula zinc finger protein xFG20-1-like [Thrips palmi]|uniref:Gastrula zinc finger protein xFG20-1-like n=1 Tax=Thrips palmi TaxID=161013 RepID=A0A6P8Y1N5_THRPL|nr:gastrula zinc finger protein xFG20-1-like [Thrips palmi]
MAKRRNLKKSGIKIDESLANPDCRCFICDKHVDNNGIQIILGRTPYSNVSLPAKIGQLIGDSLMVVVGVSDTMCASCASLISHLDKLETDARSVKKTLMGYIAAKYQLNHQEICDRIDITEADPVAHKEASNLKSASSQSTGQMQREGSRKKSRQVSLLVSNSKNRKVTSLHCLNCNFTTTDKDAFQIHSALCVKQVNQCLHCGHSCSPCDQVYSFTGTCKVCSLIYGSEDEYSNHMSIHIISDDRCAACGVTCSDKNNLVSHILNHGEQSFMCSACPTTFNLKSNLNDHMESHMMPDKCLKCSIDFVSQAKQFTASEFTLACPDEAHQSVQDKRKNVNEYMESLMRVDNFDSDSGIEFHSCPSCGLTFLNKMLFSEHMKMHNESQDQVIISEAHEEALQSATVSVAGDCSIDDELEDLFEKLHAETTKSSVDNSCSLSDQLMNAQHHTELSMPLKEEMMTLCPTVAAVEVSQPPCKLVLKNQNVDSTDHIETDKNKLEPSFDMSLLEKENSSNSVLPEAMFDATQHQTFIYISSNEDGLTDCDSLGNLVLHKATIDPESGNIHLLPFIASDEDSASQLISPLLSNPETFRSLIQDPCEGELAQVKDKQNLNSSKSNDEFSCNHCSFQTSIELVLKRHLKIHQSNLVQKCSICNRAFSSTQRLLSHLDLRHKSSGPITCPFCLEEFSSSAFLRNHMNDKHPVGKQNFSCRFCSKKLPTRKECTIHEESHSEIFKYQCKTCAKKFTTQDDLDDHVKWDHEKVGQCRYCGKQIDKPKALKNHELRHMQESNHHECVECKRVFKTKTGLRHHAASHTGQFKYCCDFCGRGFMSRMMLEEHRSCHTKEERYICDVCGQKFTFQSTYWIHRKWHENPYPYKCNYCGRFFKHSSLLAVHKRKHTGERPYKCPHCPLTFPVSGTLKRHIILHTGVYPFNCDVCKRGFTARHKYSSHLEKVHGIEDLVNEKLSPNMSKVEALDVTEDGSIPESIKDWNLGGIVSSEESNVPAVTESSVVDSRGPLINDESLPSRVVEIVLNDSHQAVATVTLGGTESVLPENWYE